MRETPEPLTGSELVYRRHEAECGMRMEALAAVAGVVLGVLALIGISLATLQPVSLVAMLGIGAAVLLNGSTIAANLFGMVS